MSMVVFINGVLTMGMGALMGLVALIYPGTRAIFFEATLFTIFVGGCLCLATANSLRPLRREHTFLLTSSAWVVAAGVGAR